MMNSVESMRANYDTVVWKSCFSTGTKFMKEQRERLKDNFRTIKKRLKGTEPAPGRHFGMLSRCSRRLVSTVGHFDSFAGQRVITEYTIGHVHA
jgi:hypothetical protein